MNSGHQVIVSCLVLLACSCGARDDTQIPSSEPVVGADESTGPEPSAALVASDEEAKAWAQETLAGLSLRQKIAQMICEQMQGNVAQDSPEFARVLRLVRENEIGALVVYGGTPVKTAALFNRLQEESKLPLLVSMDFEGGPGQQWAGATEFPANMALAAIGSEEIAYQVGRAGAAEGRACGGHITYSPGVDVSTRPDKPASSVRSFGGDIKLVGRMAAAYIRGYQDGGMLATAKHFPGRGDVDPIPGTLFAANNKPAEQVEAEDFAAFKAAIDAGVTYIMSEHVAVPSVTGGSDLPASVSKDLITGWLRGKLGFEGIITTDDMWYDHVVKRFGPVKACVMAVQAGHDAVLKPADVAATIDGLVAAVKAGEIPEQQIDASVEKILYQKAKLNLHRNRLVDLDKIADVVACPNHTELLNTVADRSLVLLVNKGFFPTDVSQYKRIAHVSVQKNPGDPNVAVVATKLFEGLSGVEHFALGAKDAAFELPARALDAARSAALVIVSLFCQRNRPGDTAPLREAEAKLLDEIIRLKPDATVVMSYGNPYFANRLDGASALVVGFGESGWYGNQTIYADSCLRRLKGEISPEGKLPIKVSDKYPIGSGITY